LIFHRTRSCSGPGAVRKVHRPLSWHRSAQRVVAVGTARLHPSAPLAPHPFTSHPLPAHQPYYPSHHPTRLVRPPSAFGGLCAARAGDLLERSFLEGAGGLSARPPPRAAAAGGTCGPGILEPAGAARCTPNHLLYASAHWPGAGGPSRAGRLAQATARRYCPLPHPK